MRKLAISIFISLTLAILSANQAAATYKNPASIVMRIDFAPNYARRRPLKKPLLLQFY